MSWKGGRTMSDLIEREAACLVCSKYFDSDGCSGDDVAMDIQSDLLGLPSAQPETAKRIVGKSRGGMTLWYQCDMCNEPVDAQDNFCRGCGRRLTDG